MSLHNRGTFGAFGWACGGEGFVLKCAAWGREVSYVPGWGRVHWREGRAEGQTDMVGRAAPPGQGREGGRRRGSVTMQFSRDRKGGGVTRNHSQGCGLRACGPSSARPSLWGPLGSFLLTPQRSVLSSELKLNCLIQGMGLRSTGGLPGGQPSTGLPRARHPDVTPPPTIAPLPLMFTRGQRWDSKPPLESQGWAGVRLALLGSVTPDDSVGRLGQLLSLLTSVR